MSSDNPTADRLVSDARKKTAQLGSPRLAQIGVVVGVLSVIAGALSPLGGWVLGAAAAVLAGVSMLRDVAVERARVAMLLGVVGILVGTFSFTWLSTRGIPWYQSF